MTPRRYVVRIDSPKHAGYQGRVYHRRYRHRGHVPFRSKYFADAAHGGKRKALAKAERWIRRGGK